MSGQPESSIRVIVNPRSARGRAGRAWKNLRPRTEALLGSLEAWETQAPGQATELARSALRQGCRTLIAMGGDGTISEVVSGFFDEDRLVSPQAVLGIVPQGSACDLRRTLQIPLEGTEALEIIRRGATRKIDVTRVRFRTGDGSDGQRYSVNVTSFGLGGAVAARFNRMPKVLGGRLSFLLAAASVVLGFRGNRVTLRLDGRQLPKVTISNIAVGNGQYHGGGMWVCPRAAIDDGRLDVTVMRRFSLWEMLLKLPWLYNGRVYDHPKVDFHAAARLEATADEATFIEVDGEPLGQLPLEINVLPQALRVYAPAS